MQLDLEDYRPDTPPLDPVISVREGVLLSIIAHLLVALMFAYAPQIPWLARILHVTPEQEAARQAELARQREAQRAPEFVFVEPRTEVPTPAPPPRAELSDRDRRMQSPETRPRPENPLPYSRGNTTERVDNQRAEPARGQGPEPTSSDPRGSESSQSPVRTDRGPQAANSATAGAPAGGGLGTALRNLQKYVDDQRFNNPGGDGGSFGPAIQFDTKGVEFGPWVRRFVAQVKRNWFIPYAAMSFKGNVVITFNVHKDGRITDVTIARPSSIDAFNSAAYNAILASSPTQPLPPEYPSPMAFFTVTFYYNEQPPS